MKNILLPNLYRVHASNGIYNFELEINNKSIVISDILGGLQTYVLKSTYIADNDSTPRVTYTILWHRWCEDSINMSVVLEGLLTADEVMQIKLFDEYMWNNPIFCGLVISMYKSKKNIRKSIQIFYQPKSVIRVGVKLSEAILYCGNGVGLTKDLITPPLLKSYLDKKNWALKHKLEANPDYFFTMNDKDMVDNFHEEYSPAKLTPRLGEKSKSHDHSSKLQSKV